LIVATTSGAPESRREALEAAGAEVLVLSAAGPIDIPSLLDELGRRAMTNVLVEGGGRTLGSFLDCGEVDAVEVFVAPIIEGGRPAFVPAAGKGVATMSEALRLDRHEVQVIDGDVYLKGTIARPWQRVGPA
jgi:diaminohydroxyphosphoribosylaminopyrimidine deaminase/5-amino-6-(5-phosphoribosylamino)uracil reductase